jgi:hypothetical protein
MPGTFLLSSAYFPPISFISLILKSDKVLIEKEENYLKQSYRNRCRILTANGLSILTVPVLSATFKKICIKDVRIDYSRRWQQVHIRALISAYRSSPFFEYYFDLVEKIITSREVYLFDLNRKSLETVLEILKISKPVDYTVVFIAVDDHENDFRYNISPKKAVPEGLFLKEYFQVFNSRYGFIQDLSVLDLIFNVGPDSLSYL